MLSRLLCQPGRTSSGPAGHPVCRSTLLFVAVSCGAQQGRRGAPAHAADGGGYRPPALPWPSRTYSAVRPCGL
jgi:hypothetical protein